MTCDHDALRLPCPTCGGTGVKIVRDAHRTGEPIADCPDCTDGRMSHERAWKIVAAVQNFTGDLFTEEGARLLDYLQGIR